MSPGLAAIRRHPVKGVGSEALARCALVPGRPVPGDRAWAVMVEGGTDTGRWQPCAAFARGAKAPALMAVETRSDGARLTFSHPGLATIAIDPATDGERLVAWVAPLCPAGRPPPARLVRAPDAGMSDAPYASVSLLNLASLRALSERIGRPLDPRRFRANLWLDGLAPWVEAAWPGARLRIGGAELEVVEPITRCRATEADPETGKRDTDTLGELSRLRGATEFGVYATVVGGGDIAPGAPVAPP